LFSLLSITIIIIIITDSEAYSKKPTTYEQVKTMDKISVAQMPVLINVYKT